MTPQAGLSSVGLGIWLNQQDLEGSVRLVKEELMSAAPDAGLTTFAQSDQHLSSPVDATKTALFPRCFNCPRSRTIRADNADHARHHSRILGIAWTREIGSEVWAAKAPAEEWGR